MRFYPTRIHLAYLCFVFLSVLLNLACSKDSDLLRDAIFEDESVSSVENIDPNNPEAQNEEESIVEEEVIEEVIDLNRTTSFPPIHDAHVQSGKGYNQNLIRLEENSRTSYLMFDLTPIAEISGKIATATLQLTIHSDDGNGSIKIHKGTTNDWTEGSLSENTAPELEVELGSITKEFPLNETELIELNPDLIAPEIYTLVLSHVGGNDIAFASKEHADKIGPKLVVTYEAPEGSEEIIIEEDTTEDVEDITEDTTEDTTDTTEDTEDTTEDSTGTTEDTADTTEDSTDTSEEEEQQPENQEPMAVADGTPSTGGAPLEVTFKGSNSNDDKEIKSYSWNFKDGTSSTAANPTHTFTEVGVYEVELSVTDAEGLTNTDKVTVTVTEEQNNAPKAIVSATPTSGEAPLRVAFKGSSSTDDHSIASYGWDFKDGSKTNVADFSYTYTTPGTYEAELTVTDANGLSDKETITITVTEPKNVAPVAVVSSNITSGIAPLQVQFTGDKSTDDDTIASYAWNFKDGTSATTANPSHSFGQAGTYAVDLTVTDNNGLSNTKSITITVNAAPSNSAPVAAASASTTSGEAPLTVQFNGSGSTDDNAVTSYYWDFKDGNASSTSNPSNTFNTAGSYSVSLTVKDAQGLSSTKSLTITVSAPVTNAPPGYYVATNGSASNNGQSPSSPWSLEHAFNTARAGDVVYVKAGNYGRKDLLTKYGGSSGNPVKFIGYRNTPGDVNSSGNPTFNYGESVSASKMPLLSSSNGKGIAINVHRPYVHIENFQINNYGTGVQTLDIATNLKLKNVIVTNSGNQYNSNAYDGFGITVRGNNSVVEDSFVLNAVAQGITLSDSDYSLVKNCRVYADNNSNPADYYVLLADGTNNSVVENTTVSRGVGLSHNGHGLNLKNDATYNTIKNCTAIRTSFELTYYGVHHNTIDGGQVIGEGTSKWEARMVIVGGAHHNTIKNLNIKDTWTAISLTTFNDRTGLDASLGNDNVFNNVTVQNTDRIFNVGGGTNYLAKAKNYQFNNCNFSNFKYLAVALYGAENMKFSGSSFSNGDKLIVEGDGVYEPYSKFQATWQNCSWSNVNFTPPN